MTLKNTLAAFLLCIAPVSCAEAQLRSWSNSANGLWTDASKWSGADVPDTSTESAKLERFGTFAVSIPGGQSPLIIGGLETGFGDITLRANGVADAALHVTGEALIGGASSLRFTDVAGTSLDFQVGGQMRVEPGADWSIEAGNVTTDSLSIATPTSSIEETRVSLLSGATAAFGDVAVADLAGPARSELSLYSGSSVTVDDLSVGVGAASLNAEVNIDGATLTQNAGGTTTIGFPQQTDPGRATIALSGSGSASFEAVEVRRTGKLINSSGSLRIGESLSIVGGTLQELGTATRDFASLGSISITSQGELDLIGTPLLMGAGQALTLDQGSLNSQAGLVIDSGATMLIGASSPSDVSGTTTLKPGGSIDLAPGGVATFADDFFDEGGTFTVPSSARVVFSGDYSGTGIAGPGRVEADNALRPGMSIGVASFGGDLATEKLIVEIADVGQNDRVEVAGEAELDDQLVVELVTPSLYTPAAGDVFPVLTAESITGGFTSLVAPTLEAGLAWRIEQKPTSLTLRVVATSLPGDFNYDGAVDAADYSVWRDTVGSSGTLLTADANGDNQVNQADYLVWQGAYGSRVAMAVPEPATAAMLASSLFFAACGGRIRRAKLAEAAQRL